MKPSFGTLLLLSGITLAAPIAATAAVVHQIDNGKRTTVVELAEDQREAKKVEEAATPKTNETEILPQTSPADDVDLSGVDWVALARSTYGRCGEYRNLALSVGWPAEQWPKISKVMYRESRCNFDSFNPTDPAGGSRGLMQVNGSWCKKNRWNPHPAGYLGNLGILTSCEDLFNPEINLRSSLALWQYSQDRNGCGWRPWSTSCR